MKILVVLAVLSLSAVGKAVQVENLELEQLGIVDSAVTGLLNSLRETLKNLTIGDFNQTINNPLMNGTIKAGSFVIKNAHEFKNDYLDTSLIPIKIKNCTLTWSNVTLDFVYDVDVSVNLDEIQGPTRVFGKGAGRVALKKVFFTIGAWLRLALGYVQITEDGLFGFDFRLGNADISLESLMGSQDIGKLVSTFLSSFIPNFINDVKFFLFDTYNDQIIDEINKILKG